MPEPETKTADGGDSGLNFLKIVISIACIGTLTGLTKDTTTREERSQAEIAFSILFAAWILSGRW